MEIRNYNLSTLVYAQMWEFFSTYGMTALLVIFLTQNHQLPDKTAYLLFCSYMALLHSSPLLASFFITRKFSLEYAVVSGGILMALGHFTMSLPNLFGVYISLALMIAGYGLFTPSLIALTGSIKTNRSNESKFTLFYVGQNIGSMIAPIGCSYIGYKYGWGYGFSLGGLGMLTGLLVFCRALPKGKFFFDKRLASLMIYMVTMVSVSYLILNFNVTKELLFFASMICFILIINVYRRLNIQERSSLLYILSLIFFMIIFFSMLSQGGTSIILFINRIVNKHVLSLEVFSPMLLSIESLLMILISPIFFSKKSKLINRISPAYRYISGLLVMSIAFLVFSLGAKYSMNTNLQCSIWVIIIAFAFFSSAELLIMPTGYAEITRLFKNKNLSFILAIWGLSQAIARCLAQEFSSLAEVIDFSEKHIADAATTYFYAFNSFSIYLLVAAFVFLSSKLYLNIFRRNNLGLSNSFQDA